MSIDSIGNFLTVIRNSIMVANPSVVVPYSKMRLAITQTLKNEGFVRDFEVINAENPAEKKLKVLLKYVDGESVIHEITRISTPGRRSYSGIKNVKPIIGGLGLSILSTDRGVLSHREAKALGIGGEILCTVW